MAREGFLKDKCGPRAKKFEYHCLTVCRHTEAGVERKRPSWDPKDGESEETPVEDRGDSGMQIDRQIWVQGRKTHRTV